MLRHYDDEALIALLEAGDESAGSDEHLAVCSQCVDLLDSYRAMADALEEKSVWEPESRRDGAAALGAANLRGIATTMAREDGVAASLVDELLVSPRQWWVPTVARDSRYHSQGVIRRLVEVSEQKIDTMPPDALELAAAAINVAGALEGRDDLHTLRGAAWRQHAYALFYTGDFARALESVDRAEESLRQCVVSEYGLARVDIVRALVYGAQERYDEALSVARRATNVFRAFGDEQRLASAQMTRVYLLMLARQVRDALSILIELRDSSANLDHRTRALTFHNMGVCYQDLGQITQAVDALQMAATLYNENGTTTEAARAQFNIGVLLFSQGKRAEAKKVYREVQAEFARLGMAHDSVLAGLDLAEIALLESEFIEVEEHCRTAIRQFEAAGVPYSSEALTALTFLREAATQRRATQEIVWHVKTYIRRLPDEPALLFAPAPLRPI